MTSNLTCVRPDQTVGDLYKLFSKVNFHHLPVVEGEQLVGIVSDRDVAEGVSPFVNTVNARMQDQALLEKLVSEVMTPSPVVIDKTTSIDCASILLLENNISCLPIVDEADVLEGLLTWKDILRFHVYHGDISI